MWERPQRRDRRDTKVPPTFHSPPHDVDGEDAALVPREQIINKISDDRVRFVAELRHDAADESAAACVPFQVNRAVDIIRTMNLGPTVRARGLFRPDLDEMEFLLQLRIAHDLVAQRTASCRDDLNHRLHFLLVGTPRCGAPSRSGNGQRSALSLPFDQKSRLHKRTKHNVNIDKPFLRVSKRARQRADNLEAKFLPQVHGRFVR
jgi:hypothetical protein